MGSSQLQQVDKSSSLSSLKLVHSKLLTDYGCTEWAPPAADAADDEQQSDDDNARPLPIHH